MRAAVSLIALLGVVAAVPSTAGAVTLEGARSKALQATTAERARGGVILFGLRSPLRSRTQIRESGRRPPPTGASRRAMRRVLAVRERAYLFYLDRGAHRSYEHPGRVVLVGAVSGRVIKSRSLRFAPTVGGRLPVFLRSREGYEDPRYRVFSRAYSVGGSARAASPGLSAFGATAQGFGLRSAASERAVAARLAAERSCTVAVGGRRGDDLSTLGSASGSSVLPLLVYDQTGTRSLASFIASQAIGARGCRDVLIAISGDGYGSLAPASTRTGLSTSGTRMREYHVNAAVLRAIIAANPSVTFKLVIDGQSSGSYIEALSPLANVLVIASSSSARQTAFRYLPSKRIGGRLTNNPLRMRADSSFLTTQLFGAAAFAASDAEVAHAAAEVDAGRAPSFLAYLVARAFQLSRPFDFTSDLGQTPRLYTRFAVTPPGPTNRAPVANAQTVTATEDTPKAIVLSATDPDADALTYAVGTGPAHGTLSGSAPNLTYTPAANYHGPDSFTFTASDGSLVSAAAAVTIAVAAADDPPVTTASGTLAYTENDPATAIAPALTVADIDSANLTGATVQVTANLQSGADVLALAPQAGIASAYDAPTGTLTLSGSATVAAYEAALRAVTYANTSDSPASSPRSVTFRSRDAGGFGPAATRTVTVTPVNDPPAITTSADSLSYTENDPAKAIDGGLVLTDPDSQITGATVRITTNLAGGEDLLALPAQPGIAGAYNPATGTLTLTGTASVAAYQTALRAVTYRNTSTNPSTAQRTVTFVASDASSSSAPATRAIAVNASNNAPDVDNSAGALAYTENDPATAIDTAITITDPDSASLTGATVQITGNYVQGQDILAFTPAGGVSAGSFDAPTGRLTLTGTASVAAYEAALEAVTYRNTSDAPSTATRTVTFQARDVAGFGVPDTRAVTIAAVDDAPVAVNDSATVAEDSGASAVAVLANDTDVDAGPRSVASVTQPASGTVVITGGGTGLTYAPNASSCNSPPGTTPDTFTYTLAPGSSTATVSMTVTCADDPPVAVDDSATVAEDSGSSAVDVLANDTDIDGGPIAVGSVTQPANGLVVNNGTSVSYTPSSDSCNSPPGTTPDSFTYTLTPGSSSATVSVTVTCGDDPPVAVADGATVGEDSGSNPVDVLANDTDADGGPRSVASVTQPANGAVAITGGGTAVSYTPNANYCNSPPAGALDTFTYTLDGGSVALVAMTVTCANDAPNVTTSAGSLAYTENAAATPIDAGATVTDVDSNLVSATVAITAGFQSGQDVLALSGSHAPITASLNAGGDVLTLSGTASPAAYQAALRAVTYRNTSDNPSTVARTATFTVDDGALTDSDTRGITVSAVNDPPAAVDDSATVAEDSGSSAVDVLANDTDADGGAITVASVTQPANGVVSIAAGNTAVNYQPDADYCNSPPGTTPDTFTYTLNGGSTATVSMTVTCLADPPSVTTSGGSLAYTENQAATAIDAGVTVTDGDSNLVSATVAITAGFQSGQDVLALSGSHAPITASLNAGGDVLTLTGMASPAAYQAALRAVTYRNTSDNPSTAARTATFTVSDGALTDGDTRAITVSAADDPPVAVANSATVAEDSGATLLDVLANDTDVDGGPKSVASVTQPANGSVVNNSSSVSYTPDANYCNVPPGGEPDSFTYTLNGGSVASVAISVTCVADAPVVNTGGTLAYVENDPATAIDPAITVTDPDAGATIASATVQITANHAGAQDVLALANAVTHLPISVMVGGDTLTLSGSASPAAYQAALRDVTYVNTSEAPSTLTRIVTFTATDNTALSGSDTRAISVASVDDPPVAVDDSATVLEDAAATAVPVLLNDTDLDGGPKSITSVTQPANGTVVITGGGTGLTYQPDANYCNDPPGTTLSTFAYTLTPGGATATVSMTVTCVNDAPVADDETFSGAQGAIGNTAFVGNDPSDGAPAVAGPKKTITGDILDGDADVDGPGPLVVTAGTFATNDGGSVVIESDGDFTFTPAAGTSCSDASDFFDYTVSDQNTPTAATDVGRVTIAIAGCVWYVHNNAAGNAGTSTAPFDTLAQAESASAAGHTIFVFDGDNTTTGYATGIDLKASQRLLGEAASLQIGADLLHTAIPANRPTLTDSGADVVALASGNTVRGVQLDPQGAGGAIAGALGDSGGTIDDVRIIDTGTAGTQPSLELDTTAGTFDISDLTVDNSAATGATSGSIGVRLNNAGTVNFAGAGTISITTAGAKGLEAAGATTNMGAGSVFDSITVTGSGSGGVSMLNTTGTTTFSNLALTTSSGPAAGILLQSAGSVTVSAGGTANVSATGGPAIDVLNTSGATLAFDDVDSANSAGAGVVIAGLGAGTFTASASSLISSAAGIDFDLDGGTGAVTYDGAITDNTGQLVRVQNTSNGLKDFNGAITGLAAGAGGSIGLSGNSGATIRFDGGVKLSSSGASSALSATGGGTLAVTDPASINNTLGTTTSTGQALNVANTTIHNDDLTFESIRSSTAANGIVLNTTTNANGRLVVTGNGGTCSSAANCSGGAIQSSTGAGISLTSVPGGASLTRMSVNGGGDDGIRAATVASGIALDSSVVSANGNAVFERGLDYANVTGSSTIASTTVTGSAETNAFVANDVAGTNTLAVTGSTFSSNSTALGAHGMELRIDNAATLNASVTGSTLSANRDNAFLLDNSTGSPAMNLHFNGNDVLGGNPSMLSGQPGIVIAPSAGAQTKVEINDNDVTGTIGRAIIVNPLPASTSAAQLDATVTNNRIGNGTANSGSAQGEGMMIRPAGNGDSRIAVRNNTVRNFEQQGIRVLAQDASLGTASADVTLTGNVVSNPDGAGFEGIYISAGSISTDNIVLCADVGGAGALENSFAGSGTGGVEDIGFSKRFLSDIQLPGFDANPANLTSYIQNRNAGAPSVVNYDNNLSGHSGACALPTLPP